MTTEHEMTEVMERLKRIEEALAQLLARHVIQESYSTAELAEILGKAEFTVREWCRLGRINAEKSLSGRGNSQEWKVTHEELLRIKREGLIPHSEAMPMTDQRRAGNGKW